MKKEDCIRKGLPTEDEDYNNLEYAPVDGEALDALIAGMEVIGAEPTDYPLTDGVTIYLRGKDGNIKALDIGADIFNTETEENPFYVSMANFPAKKG